MKKLLHPNYVRVMKYFPISLSLKEVYDLKVYVTIKSSPSSVKYPAWSD